MATAASTPGDELIQLDRVTLRVGGRWILPETSWTIRRGQNWLVIGPNGAGKTSLTAALTGEVPVVAGRRRVDPDNLPETQIARLSFETHQQLIARDEARDEDRGFAGIADAGLIVRSLLEGVGSAPGLWAPTMTSLELFPLLDQPLRSLSTGEMRRVLLARALLRAPRLLILDEPFDGLDSSGRRQLADMMSALAQNGLQIVLVTHRQDEILPVMTHCLELGENRVLRQGALASLSVGGSGPKCPRPWLAPAPIRPLNGKPPAPSQDASPMIRMVNASVSYGKHRVLDRLDWCVRPGENWLVSGPNGAGKSTLLRLISADHLQAYANDIYLFGCKRGTGESIWEIKQRIGLVSCEFQVRYRQPVSGYQTVLSGFFDSVGLFRLAGKKQRQRARDWMKRLEIEHLADTPINHMSSGQRRMVLIARAVVKDPDVLILDEPCQGLDADNRKRVLAMAAFIGAESPTNLIFTTHHVDEYPACMTHELRLEKEGAWHSRCLHSDET